MASKNRLSSYPGQVPSSTERAHLKYTRMPGHFAIHGGPQPGAASRASGAPLLNLDEGIAIYQGDPDRSMPAGEGPTVTPVYKLEPGGPMAVPTGLVLVRFAEGVRAQDRLEALAGAGYSLEKVLPHAPHAAWVRPSAGGIAAALRHVNLLEGLADVVNVEPQMIMPRARK